MEIAVSLLTLVDSSIITRKKQRFIFPSDEYGQSMSMQQCSASLSLFLEGENNQIMRCSQQPGCFASFFASPSTHFQRFLFSRYELKEFSRIYNTLFFFKKRNHGILVLVTNSRSTKYSALLHCPSIFSVY